VEVSEIRGTTQASENGQIDQVYAIDLKTQPEEFLIIGTSAHILC
jgi:hypothetical protein